MARESTRQLPPEYISGFLNEQDLAMLWGISHRTLQRWRRKRVGPAFVRIGGSIRYAIEDARAFEQHIETGRQGSSR